MEVNQTSSGEKYRRVIYNLPGTEVAINGTTCLSQTAIVVDVYSVIVAWKVTCPAIAHAIKKLLMPGGRGHKDRVKDLKEAKDAIDRAIQLTETEEAE